MDTLDTVAELDCEFFLGRDRDLVLSCACCACRACDLGSDLGCASDSCSGFESGSGLESGSGFESGSKCDLGCACDPVVCLDLARDLDPGFVPTNPLSRLFVSDAFS